MAVELYDEHEQSERVRNWLKENGVSIFLGVALALAGIFGWRQWQDYRADRAVLANEYYAAIQQELGAQQVDAAAEQLDAMREGVGSHAYVAMAGMLVAAAWAEAGEIDKAASVYSELLEQGDWRSLEPLARIRLALLEAARGQGEAGLRLLAGEPVEEYRGLWLETRGDILFDLGQLEAADEAYAAAVEQLRGSGRNFRQAEIKLDAVRSALGAPEPS